MTALSVRLSVSIKLHLSTWIYRFLRPLPFATKEGAVLRLHGNADYYIFWQLFPENATVIASKDNKMENKIPQKATVQFFKLYNLNNRNNPI